MKKPVNKGYRPYNTKKEDQPVIKKMCYLCQNKITTLDYKDTNTLRRFMSPHAKIMGRKRTGSCPKHQRLVTIALKRARHMALMPFVSV